MSSVVASGGLVFLAGQVPDDPTAEIQTQTRQVLAKIERLLALSGCSTGNVVSATIWLTDMRYFQLFNEIWDNWVPEGCAPARACVQALLANPDFKVEISIVAEHP